MSENEIKRIQQVDDAKLTLDKHIETNEYYPSIITESICQDITSFGRSQPG